MLNFNKQRLKFFTKTRQNNFLYTTKTQHFFFNYLILCSLAKVKNCYKNVN